jgi:hypothetical protein
MAIGLTQTRLVELEGWAKDAKTGAECAPGNSISVTFLPQIEAKVKQVGAIPPHLQLAGRRGCCLSSTTVTT